MADGRDAVRALSWAEVDAIRERFADLNPYDADAVPGSILKLEDENYALCGERGHDRDKHGEPRHCVCTKRRKQLWVFGLSAKRYCLFNLDREEPQLRKVSEHSLGGVYRDPLARPPRAGDRVESMVVGDDAEPETVDERRGSRTWVWQACEWRLRQELGLRAAEPSYLNTLAASQTTVATPALLRPFRGYNAGKLASEQVRPSNFLLLAHPLRSQAVHGSPMAPYETQSGLWPTLPWVDRHSGTRVSIGWDRDLEFELRRLSVKTFRDVLTAYFDHAEGEVGCARRRLLRRRDARPSASP